jgi:hypothetical protein
MRAASFLEGIPANLQVEWVRPLPTFIGSAQPAAVVRPGGFAKGWTARFSELAA